MFKDSQLIVLGLLFLVVLYFMTQRKCGAEHMKANRDNSKNWDVPELSSGPALTPYGEEVKKLNDKVKKLQTDLNDIKNKV